MEQTRIAASSEVTATGRLLTKNYSLVASKNFSPQLADNRRISQNKKPKREIRRCAKSKTIAAKSEPIARNPKIASKNIAECQKIYRPTKIASKNIADSQKIYRPVQAGCNWTESLPRWHRNPPPRSYSNPAQEKYQVNKRRRRNSPRNWEQRMFFSKTRSGELAVPWAWTGERRSRNWRGTLARARRRAAEERLPTSSSPVRLC